MIQNESIIYESPDGGKTIFTRKFGDSQKTCIKENPEILLNKRLAQWREILILSEKIPQLKTQIEQIETLYVLYK